MLKRVIRSAARRFKAWLDDGTRDNLSQMSRHPLEDDFAWPGLNSIFSGMVNGGVTRHSYAWGMLQGVNLASALRIPRVSVIEFGVAGGNGLVEMEKISDHLKRHFEVEIDVYGFDTGGGLPDVMDYRDVPNLASSGLYKMDQQKLRGRLRKAQLVIGDVKETIAHFVASKASPVAFIACDLVLYTSTVHALRILDADEKLLLPRIHCFFDDVLGFTFGDHNGERLAIHEFNAARTMRKISPLYGLRYYLPANCFNTIWAEQFWMAHVFDHSLYGVRDNLVKQHNLELSDQTAGAHKIQV